MYVNIGYISSIRVYKPPTRWLISVSGCSAPAFAQTTMDRDQIPMKNWATGEVVGWWDHIGDHSFGNGLACDYWPAKEDGAGFPEVVPYHQHLQGYWWLRLPGKGDQPRSYGTDSSGKT